MSPVFSLPGMEGSAGSRSYQQAASLRPKIPSRPSCTSLPHPPGLWAAAGILAWQRPGPGPRPHPPADMLLLFPSCQLGPVLRPGPAHPNLSGREGDKKRDQEMWGGGGQGTWHTPKKVEWEMDKG